MDTVLDIECTFTEVGTKTNPTPYHPSNKLVSVGVLNEEDDEYYVFNHSEYTGSDTERNDLQRILDNTSLLIGHNIKFDLNWIKSCGFVYGGPVWDTMIFEYVLAKGMKTSLSLGDLVVRYSLGEKSDILDKYIAQGINVDAIPLDELVHYGRFDVELTQKLYQQQKALLESDLEVQSMWPCIQLMNDFLPCIAEMEANGVAIDEKTLYDVKLEYIEESARLKHLLEVMVQEVMGDTPVNLNSSEQLSQVVYSRKVLNKEKWAKTFNLGQELRNGVWKNKYPPRMKPKDFVATVRDQTEFVYKTEACQCPNCFGSGRINRIKKDGNFYKTPNICKVCKGTGITYNTLDKRAGFKVFPISAEWASSGGFSVSTEVIDVLLTDKLNKKAKEFLTTLSRYNAVQTYLGTFVEGIERNIINGILHPNYNQCITATGRLSASNPNTQNFPRERTFPVRAAFISRFEGGWIVDVDFSQLEFRTAGELSGDEQIKADITNKVDIHAFTRDTLCAAGQMVDRQGAKSHCIPLTTEILTPDGWKKYSEIKVGDTVINYNDFNKRLVQDKVLEVIEPHEQEVIRMSTGQKWYVDSTKEHRWFCDKRVDAGAKGRVYEPRKVATKDIHTEHRIITAANYLSEGSCPPQTAAILAWLWTDGYEQTSQCGISQKKYTQEVENILEGYEYTKSLDKNGVYRYRIRMKEIYRLYIEAGLKRFTVGYNKFVLSLSSEARKAWLNAVCLAEGTKRVGGEWRIAQNTGPLCEAIKLAGFLEGYDIRTTKVIMKYNGNSHEQVTLRKKNYVTGQRIKKESLGVQQVWCIRTNNNSIVIKDGDNLLISGNSFKPIYGGQSGTEAEMAYYKAFLKKYRGLDAWQKKIAQEVLTTKQYQTPSGRIYAYPFAKRTAWGSISPFTQIVNYPVQGFATGDIVPATIIEIWKAMKGMKSKIILTVHDSITIDVHPEEVNDIAQIVKTVFDNLVKIVYDRFKYELTIPLEYDISIGKNWMEKNKI